jgi:hypothetical protein
VALHGLGDGTLPLVEAGVVEGEPGAAGDVLQQWQVGGGVGDGAFRAAQGEGAEDLAQAAEWMPVASNRRRCSTAMPESGGPW